MREPTALTRWRSFVRRLNTPGVVALIVAVAYAAYLAARLENLACDPARFVFAGDEFCDPARVPSNLPVGIDTAGYDGQFYYRLALDPFSAEPTAFGIRLDNPPYRQQRILYPLLVWTLSLGRAESVPAAMILVNLAALIGIGWVAGALSKACGKHALIGLMLPLYPGFVLSLARDTVEIVAAFFLLSGVLALQRKKPIVAAIVLTLAVLARETSVGFIAALAFTFVRPRGSNRDRAGLRWYVIALPSLVFLCWQAFLQQRWGRAGVFSGGGNLGPPLAGLTGFLRALLPAPGGIGELWLGEVFFLSVLTVLVVVAFRSSSAAREIKVGWLLYAGLASLLSGWIWIEDWAFLRALTEFYVLSVLLLLGARFRGRVFLTAYLIALWYVVLRTKLH